MTYSSFVELLSACSGLDQDEIDGLKSMEQLGLKSLQMADLVVSLEAEGPLDLSRLAKAKTLPIKDAYRLIFEES